MDAILTKIDTNRVLSYLGVKSASCDPIFISAIKTMSALAFEIASPRVAYRVFDSHELVTRFNSKSIEILLSGCEKAVIFCATLGFECDRLLAKTQITDMSQAVILDAVLSEAIENVCDNFQHGFSFSTIRFSPGYGDIPLDLQDFFINVTGASKIGIAITSSNLLTPQKTVSAVFGIRKEQPLE